MSSSSSSTASTLSAHSSPASSPRSKNASTSTNAPKGFFNRIRSGFRKFTNRISKARSATRRFGQRMYNRAKAFGHAAFTRRSEGSAKKRFWNRYSNQYKYYQRKRAALNIDVLRAVNKLIRKNATDEEVKAEAKRLMEENEDVRSWPEEEKRVLIEKFSGKAKQITLNRVQREEFEDRVLIGLGSTALAASIILLIAA